RLRRTGETDQARMESGDQGLEHRGRIALRIDADEDRLDMAGPIGRLLLEDTQRAADRLEIGGADIGAESITEVDQPVTAGEIAVVDGPAGLIDEGEGAAHAGALQGRLLGRLRAGGKRKGRYQHQPVRNPGPAS